MKSDVDRKQIGAFLFSFNYMQAPWRLESRQDAALSGSNDNAETGELKSLRIAPEFDFCEKAKSRQRSN